MDQRRLLLSFLLAGTIAGRAAAEPAGPRAVVDPAGLDLGTLAIGEDAVQAIAVRNDGDAPLTLEGWKASEGLSVVDSPASVPPGGEGRIHVKVDTWHVAGPSDLSLSASTNDPQQATLTIALKVTVRPFIAATPGFARYIVVQGAPEGTIGQTLWEPEGRDFGILSVESPYPYLRVSVRDARPNERETGTTSRQWRIEMTLDANAPVGPLAAFVVVRTDHPRQKEVRIPVSGFVRPMLAATPPVADLGEVDLRKPQKISLYVKSFAEEAINLLDASCDVAGIVASVEPIEAGRSYSLKLTVSAAAKEGSFAGTVRVKTDSPKKPFLEVPVKGRILSPPAAEAPNAPQN